MKRITLATAAVAVILVLGACSKNPESAVSGTSAPTGAPPSVVKIVATEHSFAPTDITVTSGTTTFQIKNDGKLEHEFEIFKGTQLGTHSDLVDEVEDIAPGLTRELKVKLDQGTYSFACMLPGHSEQGQRGVLTVT